MRYTLAVPLIAVVASVVAGAQNKPRQELKEVTPEKVDSAVYQRLTYRYIGPEGNRVTSVTGKRLNSATPVSPLSCRSIGSSKSSHH